MDWAGFAVGASSTATTIGAGLAVIAKKAKGWVASIVTDTVTDGMKSIDDKVDAMQLNLATQFGGNGGGMRQAINELRVDVAGLKGAVGALGIKQ